MLLKLRHFKRKERNSILSGRFSLSKGDDDNYLSLANIEYSIPTNHCHSYISQDDENLTISLACGLFAFWLSLEPISKNYKDFIHLSFHDNTIWWKFNRPAHYWSSKTPKYLDGCFHIDDFFLGKPEYSSETLQEKHVLIPMPEKAYKAIAKLSIATWKRSRWFAEKLKRINFEMIEPVPIPGKGENSYDCDDDAIFSMTIPAETIEDGIGEFVKDVLKTRMKRMGKHIWNKNSLPKTCGECSGFYTVTCGCSNTKSAFFGKTRNTESPACCEGEACDNKGYKS